MEETQEDGQENDEEEEKREDEEQEETHEEQEEKKKEKKERKKEKENDEVEEETQASMSDIEAQEIVQTELKVRYLYARISLSIGFWIDHNLTHYIGPTVICKSI